jgi:hypothetical protein
MACAPFYRKINYHERSDDDCADYRWDPDFQPGQLKIVMSDISEHGSSHGCCKHVTAIMKRTRLFGVDPLFASLSTRSTRRAA